MKNQILGTRANCCGERDLAMLEARWALASAQLAIRGEKATAVCPAVYLASLSATSCGCVSGSLSKRGLRVSDT